MPEMYFDVQWPDGAQQRCYSPSSVIQVFFEPDTQYTVKDFVSLSEQALTEASERVKNKYGYYCSSAADQLAAIKLTANGFEAKQTVTLLRIRNGL